MRMVAPVPFTAFCAAANDLRQRLRDEIVARLDVHAWNHCQAVERAERESLNRYIAAWGQGHEYF
jgi:hypothetical protein